MTNVKKARWFAITLVLVAIAFVIGSYLPSKWAENEIISNYQASVQEAQITAVLHKEQNEDVNNVAISAQSYFKAENHQSGDATNSNEDKSKPIDLGNDENERKVTVIVATEPERKSNRTKEDEMEYLHHMLTNRDKDGNRMHPEFTEKQREDYMKRANETYNEWRKIDEEDRIEELKSEIDWLHRYVYNEGEDGKRMHPGLDREQRERYLRRMAEAKSELKELEKE